MSILELLDRPIAYHRCFVTITGSVTASVMLSQAFYWSKRTTLNGNWFWKTQEEWLDETGLTRYEQEGARKTLRNLGIFEEKKEGIPAKLYFRVNTQKIYELLEMSQKTSSKTSANKDAEFPHTGMLNTSILDAEKPTSLQAENQPYISENTTETTSKTTSDIIESAVALPKSTAKPKGDEAGRNKLEVLLSSYGITGDLAKDFVAHRKLKKAAITATALNGFKREAELAGISVMDAVTVSIERNWQGFKAEWYQSSNKALSTNIQPAQSGYQPSILMQVLDPDYCADFNAIDSTFKRG